MSKYTIFLQVHNVFQALALCCTVDSLKYTYCQLSSAKVHRTGNGKNFYFHNLTF